MKLSSLGKLFILCTGILVSGVASASIAEFTGQWRNVDSHTRGVTRLVISAHGVGVKVHAWGQCHPTDCDWGIQQGVAYGPSVGANVVQTARAVTVVYRESFKVTTLVLKAHAGRLSAEMFTRFTDNSHRNAYTESYRFVRIPGGHPVSHEDCIPFDYNRARVQKVNNRWKITVGNMFLLDFANSQANARKSLAIIKRLRMNKQCFVGRPHPSFQYYLSNNRAPVGVVPSEDCVNFNLANIRVRKINNRWKIVDGNHMMFDFANKEQEARKAFALIKKYRFVHSCFVGRPNPPMSYLKR